MQAAAEDPWLHEVGAHIHEGALRYEAMLAAGEIEEGAGGLGGGAVGAALHGKGDTPFWRRAIKGLADSWAAIKAGTPGAAREANHIKCMASFGELSRTRYDSARSLIASAAPDSGQYSLSVSAQVLSAALYELESVESGDMPEFTLGIH